MFSGCYKLTSLDVSNFDTSNVTDMSGMFSGCQNLTSLDVSNFNTSKVTDMSSMFYSCLELTSLDVSNFDTSNVTNMSGMFECYADSKLTSLDVSNFNTSKVTDMSSMFMHCLKLNALDVSNFDTSNVTDMHNMFYSCSGLTSLDVSNFDTSNVTDMLSMFYSCPGLTSLDVSNFDTSNVTDMRSMFMGCTKLAELDLSNFDTTRAPKMDNMFQNCRALEKVTLGAKFTFGSGAILPARTDLIGSDGKWYDTKDGAGYNIAEIRTVTRTETRTYVAINPGRPTPTLTLAARNTWYQGTTSKADIAQINIVDSYVPTGSESESWDASEAQDGSVMAYIAGANLIIAGNGSGEIFANSDSASAFEGFSSAKTLEGLSLLNTTGVTGTGMGCMFRECTKLAELDLSNFDTTGASNMDSMFYGCRALKKVTLGAKFTFNSDGGILPAQTDLIGSDGKWYDTKDGAGYTPVELAAVTRTETRTYVAIDPGRTGSALTLAARNTWYQGPTDKTAITQISIVDSYTPTGSESESWDASDAQDGSVMAYRTGTQVIVAGNGSGKIFANSDSQSAFNGFSGMKTFSGADILDTSNVTDMRNLFNGCKNLTAIEGISEWDTSKVTNMLQAFYGCTVLSSMDLSEWKTSNVTNMRSMFNLCNMLTNLGDLSGWDVSNVTTMRCMFQQCKLTSLNLSGWSTSGVTDTSYMFNGCKVLKTIYASELWSTTSVTNSAYMFYGCTALKGAIPYSASKTSANYANYTTGYLTYKAATAAKSMSIMSNGSEISGYSVSE